MAPCPDSPNCVSTLATREDQAIHPLSYSLSRAAVRAAVEEALAAEPSLRIVESSPTYLHAEATTRWLRFVDDVEIQLDVDAQLLHMRSASRTGYSDLGVNRERLERIQARLTAVDGIDPARR